MTIILNGTRFEPQRYPSEKEFENDIVASSRLLFGGSTVYIDAKKKIESKTLGAAVPDGFFFDFSDSTDPQFYVVEVELSEHNFYGHVFPQITKFFAFFNNVRLQKSLVDKLFSIVDTDPKLRTEFRRHLGHSELYKFLSDVVESSQNILLIADGPIEELAEIAQTYADTWGRMVRFLEVRRFTHGQDVIFTIVPDFETLQYTEGDKGAGSEAAEEETSPYSEDFHLENATPAVQEIYRRIKEAVSSIDPALVLNPQKYYISIKGAKNMAFIQLRKKKVRFIAMMPEARIRDLVRNHPVVSLSPGVQTFYNGPCAAVVIADTTHFQEIESLMRELVTCSGHAA